MVWHGGWDTEAYIINEQLGSSWDEIDKFKFN